MSTSYLPSRETFVFSVCLFTAAYHITFRGCVYRVLLHRSKLNKAGVRWWVPHDHHDHVNCWRYLLIFWSRLSLTTSDHVSGVVPGTILNTDFVDSYSGRLKSSSMLKEHSALFKPRVRKWTRALFTGVDIARTSELMPAEWKPNRKLVSLSKVMNEVWNYIFFFF